MNDSRSVGALFLLTRLSIAFSIMRNIPAKPRLFDLSNSMLKLCGFFILYPFKKRNPRAAQGLRRVTA
jgi:hypothetical protein